MLYALHVLRNVCVDGVQITYIHVCEVIEESFQRRERRESEEVKDESVTAEEDSLNQRMGGVKLNHL